MQTSAELENAGRAMHDLAAELYPICRSITGPGVRDTLARIKRLVPVEINEVPTGTKVFDWEVPKEWHIRDAYISDAGGRRLVDFQKSNLHVVAGSVPVHEKMAWRDLKSHLFTLPEHPESIPYRAAFYDETWGFCLSHQQFLQLEAEGDQQYEVCVDATWQDGSLTYGELYLPGDTRDEILLSTHVCHPSLANDNLSGIVVATYLAKHVAARQRRYSYRFLYLPATIGAITWLSLNEERVSHIKHGLVLSSLGDPGHSTYTNSRRGDAEIDRVVAHVLRRSGDRHALLDFEPFGYDQRQFCSPGFDLPVGCLMRTPNEQYAEYHTSDDNLDFVQPPYLADSLAKCMAVVDILENNRTWINQNPKCEPRLGKHGLYHAFGAAPDQKLAQQAALWVLNLSDGKHSLLDVADRAGIDFTTIYKSATLLERHGLLNELGAAESRVPASGEPRDVPSPDVAACGQSSQPFSRPPITEIPTLELYED